MTSDKAYYALALAAALVSITAQTAAAWDSRKECVDFYKAEAGSKNLVCDQKKATHIKIASRASRTGFRKVSRAALISDPPPSTY
jgi:hypothetical protein